MKLAKALEEKRLDVRLMDRLVAEGKLAKSEVDKYNSDLPDEEGNYEFIKEPSVTEEVTE